MRMRTGRQNGPGEVIDGECRVVGVAPFRPSAGQTLAGLGLAAFCVLLMAAAGFELVDGGDAVAVLLAVAAACLVYVHRDHDGRRGGRAFLVVAVGGLCAVALAIASAGRLPLFSLVMAAVGGVCYTLIRLSRRPRRRDGEGW